ncbi:hypothetical protein GCK72_021629 [Caenorhabditis remanei]|uniref:Uncharacterized protein n=1 Tax=Caenorhabditis remanei TaxID=31234 RepID=A0A6A5GKD4_CAERE|nr:hypothetical protein GCK72_021629 [Caenorhabditis remanei]KAF1755061.1 hypothetical protein GCK72_021629 [Caenorhabditis remanei]
MSTESLDHLSDLSDISDYSYYSDSDEGQIVKVVRRQKRNQKSGIDAEDVFCIIMMLMIAIILVTGVFTVFRAVFLRKPIQNTESARTMANTKGTFNPMDMRSLGERRMMRTSEILEDQEKMTRAQRVFESKGWSKLADVPEYYWDKFMPDITRFEGMDAYLHKTKMNGSLVEEALYFHPIKFVKISENGRIRTSWPSLNDDNFDMANVGCGGPKIVFRQSGYRIEKGDLFFEHTFTMEGGQKMIVKTVYYVPAETFI